MDGPRARRSRRSAKRRELNSSADAALCFAPKALECHLVSSNIVRQELQRYKASELRVFGLETTPMPPPPSLFMMR